MPTPCPQFTRTSCFTIDKPCGHTNLRNNTCTHEFAHSQVETAADSGCCCLLLATAADAASPAAPSAPDAPSAPASPSAHAAPSAPAAHAAPADAGAGAAAAAAAAAVLFMLLLLLLLLVLFLLLVLPPLLLLLQRNIEKGDMSAQQSASLIKLGLQICCFMSAY